MTKGTSPLNGKNTSIDIFNFFFSPGKNSAKYHPDLPQKSDFFGLNFKEAFVRPDRQNKDDSDVVPMPSTIRKASMTCG